MDRDYIDGAVDDRAAGNDTIDRMSKDHAYNRGSLRNAAAIVLAALLASSGVAGAAPPATDDGLITSDHRLATAVGMDVLSRGGNAVDAAVAVGYALAVVYPAAGNIGGGGFMTIRLADGRTTVVDFRETAPGAARETMFLDQNGVPLPQASTRGYLAVGVPGTVAGLDYALRTYGTQDRQAIMAPAIALAEKGFPLRDGDVALFSRVTADLQKDAPSAAIFLKDGKPLRNGDVLVQKDLAKSLRLIADWGPYAFYHGPIAAALVEASRAGHGILATADLARYAVQERAPIACAYKEYILYSPPPPSSGGVSVCEILHILEGYPLKEWGAGSVNTVHAMAEAMRHAFVDRNSALGDPDFIANPVDHLLDKAYAARLRGVIAADKAGRSQEIAARTPPHEGTQTTHFSVIDRQGNAVAVTYTLNDFFGARITAAGTGILLNDEMGDFTAKPGVPNLFGLVQGEANAVAPGKRPLSSMSPTVVTRDGKVVMILGAAGGARIITIVLETFLNVVEHGMTVQEALDAPRIHHQWLPDQLFAEPGALSAETRGALEAMGYKIVVERRWGDANAILTDGAQGAVGGLDIRRAVNY
jgi:gamma-glutamyltranspeptidase/glutathione hydrolase